MSILRDQLRQYNSINVFVRLASVQLLVWDEDTNSMMISEAPCPTEDAQDNGLHA